MPPKIPLEEKLIAAYLTNKCDSTRNALIEYYTTCPRPLHKTTALWVMKYYGCDNIDLELGDLESEMIIAMLKAIKSFDSNKGATLRSWIVSKMRYHTKELMRNRAKRAANITKYNEKCAEPEYTALIEIYDNLQIDVDYEAEDLLRAMDKLSNKFKAIIKMYVFEEYTFKEIAAKLHKSESRAYQMYQEAIQKLREILTSSNEPH